MSFKFFQSVDFTGQPTVDQFRSAYNIFSFYTESGAFVNNTSLSVDDVKINEVVDAAIDGHYDAVCWNENGSYLEMARAGITDAEIDAILDSLKTIYDLSKARATSRGRADLPIGFYDIPGGFANAYLAPLQYEQNPSNSTYTQNFQLWTSWLDRLNKRKIDGAYVVVPFSDSCDYLSPSVSPFYGNSVSAISDWKIFARRTIQEVRTRISGGNPLYPITSMSFSSSSQWTGLVVDSNNMTEIVSTIKLHSNGIVLHGGSGASYQYGNFRYRPYGVNESFDLAAWQTVSNGSFSVTISSNKFKVQNVNTSAATSMTAVASILQNAIQSVINSGSTYDNSYPVSLGSISVTWNSIQKSFLLTMTTNGASTPQPPNFHRGIGGFYISGKNDWGADILGTDLGVAQFWGILTINNIGSPGNSVWNYIGTQSASEWELYAEDQFWWNIFLEESLANFDIEDFKYFYWSDFTGQPNVTVFKNSYSLDFMEVGNCNPFVVAATDPTVSSLLNSGQLALNETAINTLISTYLDPSLLDSQRKFYSFDLSLYGQFFDKTLYNDVQIDNMLESYISLYNRTKQLLNNIGATDVKIGFYLTPAFKSYYDPVLYHYSKGNTLQYTEDYNAWVDKFRRINLRKSGSSYITKKFSDFVDFVTCEVYPYYGENDLYDDSYFKENILQTSRYIAGDKPLYVFIEAAFDSSTPWAGKTISEDYMIKTVAWVKRLADGAVLYTATNPSYRRARQRHFMTSSGGPPAVPIKTLSDWQTITNGCFSYFISGYSRGITGVDFSIATSVGGEESTSVANLIESAINSDLYYIDHFFPTFTDIPAFVLSRPYTVGSITFNYKEDTSDNEPTSRTRVPCFELSYTDPSLNCPPDFNSYNGREFGYCYSYLSSGAIPVGGTNIGVEDWIGTYYFTNQEYDSNAYSGEDKNPDEFNNGWALGNPWWNSYTSLADESTEISPLNRVVPFIKIVTSSSGEAPFTVHVDASDSLFNGVNPQDCIFEWDFGDSNQINSYSKRNLISDHRIDTDCDSDGNPYRATSLSNKQRGINAAYTYWHNNEGTPFTVTLKVWNNGTATSTVSEEITITNPSINDYPINTTGQWTKVQVMPNNLAANSEFPDAFQNLEAAISWMNSNKTEGKIIFELISGDVSGLTNFPIDGKITISYPNIIISGRLQRLSSIEPSSSFSRPSSVPLVEIGASAYNIHFQEVVFGKSSEASNTSKVIGCKILSPTENSVFAKNITFSSCEFVALDQAVNTKDFVTGVYFNQCKSYQTNIKTFDFLGTNIVMNACSHGESFATKVATYNQTDCIVNFGSTEGSSEKLSINFCDFRYLAHLGSNCVAGSLYLKNTKNVFICSSILNSGSNYIDDCYSVRFDANYLYAGGSSSSIIIKAPTVDITLVNNCIYINGLGILANAFSFAASNGLINNINIINNNVVVRSNIYHTKAIWDFRAATGTTIFDIDFVNNLNVENASLCISRWVSVDNISGQFNNFSNNIWPLRLGPVEFAFVSGVVKDWDYWAALGLDQDYQQVDVLVDDVLDVYKNKLLISKYPSIQNNSFFHPASSKDINDEVRSFSSQCGIGAARPLISLDVVSGAMSVSSNLVTRVRDEEVFSGSYTWTPPSAQNIFVSVTDSFVQTYDGNLQTVSKPVIKQINSDVSNMISFDPVEGLNSSTRAFRVKIDLLQNTEYKDSFFGVITESSVKKFVGILRLQDGTDQRLFDINLSSYSTVELLVAAIVSRASVLNLSGFSAQAFGSTLTTELYAEFTLANLTDKTTTSPNYYGYFGGSNVWAVSHFATTNPDIVKSGSYINTTYSVVNNSSGYDITITYVNDGPEPDDDGVSRQSHGDPRQRIGFILLDGFLVGPKFYYINNTSTSVMTEANTRFSNYNGGGFLYPFDKFSPVVNIVGQTYSTGISIKHSSVFGTESYKHLQEITSSYSGSVVSRFKWSSETQAEDLSIVNSDCLQYGESFEVSVSVRITRDVRNWVRTLEPYKTYFAQTYGSVSFMKDPRPVKIIIPGIAPQSAPFDYFDYQGPGNQAPSVYGWAWWANKIKDNYKTNGYERQLMWSLSGLYSSGNAYNFPFYVFMPLLDESNEFPHSEIINHFLYQGTSYMIRDAIQEVPVFGLYQGYGTLSHGKWNPVANTDITKASRFLHYQEGSSIDLFTNEWDLINYFAKANFLGLDAYSAGFENNDQTRKFLDFLKDRYKGIKLLTEVSPDDLACLQSMGYVFSSYGTAGPNDTADYVLPGNENLVVVWMNDVWDSFPPGTYNYWHTRNRMAALARWGYVVGHVDEEGPDSINISTYQASDRRFAFDTKTENYNPLASPSNITHTIRDEFVNSKYPTLKKQTISLFWNANTEPDFSHYLLYKAPVVNRIIDNTRPYQLKSYLKYPEFVDNQVFPDKVYYYKIISVDVYGNESSASLYQVRHIADDLILNPPTNVSVTSEVVQNDILVAWSDPSSSFLPSEGNKSPPRIIIKGKFTESEFSSPLFDLSFVYPLISEFLSLGDSDTRTMEQRASVAADTITLHRDLWRIYRPNTAFRYAYQPKNFGSGWGTSGSRLFFHDSDKLSNGNNCIWTANGRSETKFKMETFFLSLSSILRDRGIPDPIYMDSAYENGVTIAGDPTYANRTLWHGWLSGDPRNSSITVDGAVTYEQYISSLTDLDGNAIPSSELYPYIYDSDVAAGKRVHVHVSLPKMAIDYALWDSLYVPAKEVWPGVRCANLDICCANRQYLVNGYRFKEVAVDLNSNYHADLQVPINYGWFPNDGYSLTVGQYYDTYYEAAYRYGINIANIKDQHEVIKSLDLGKFEYNCRGSQLANANKPLSPWMKFLDVPVIYDNVYERGNLKFPPGVLPSSLLYDKGHVMNIFRIYNRYNVEQVGFSLDQTTSMSSQMNLVLYNKIYKVLSNLQEAGYVMP